MPSELLRDGLATRREDSENQSCGRRDEGGILERRKTDEDDAVGELVEQLGGNLHREPCLTRPPVPVNVTSPTSGRRSRSITSRISRLRPTRDVG